MAEASEGQGLAAELFCLGTGPYVMARAFGEALGGRLSWLVLGACCKQGLEAEASRELAKFFGAMGDEAELTESWRHRMQSARGIPFCLGMSLEEPH